MDRNGLTLPKAPTQVRDFYSPEEIERTCYLKVERLRKGALGAQRVMVQYAKWS